MSLVRYAVFALRCLHAAVDMLLVRDNHDARAGDPPVKLADLLLTRAPSLQAIRHMSPSTTCGITVPAGHVYLAITLRGAGHQRLRLPCYWWQPRMLILPEFGEFTGGATPVVTGDARVWPVGGGVAAVRP